MSYKNPSPLHRSRLATPVRIGAAAVAACFISGPALSCSMGSSGAAVVNGTACLTQAGSVTTVTNSNGAIIKWPTLSVPVSTTLHFQQPSASSTVLNEVLKDPTVIYGTLSSNGRVWLVNPAGIMVGPGGRVDTAGFVASTLRVNYDDFAKGNHRFLDDGSAQNVINQGEIRTPAGGSVYLIGSSVSNEGIITTPGGETILAAGATVSLIDSATPGVKVDITGAAGDATNLGTITAEAGRVGIAGVIVRNSGTLNASSAVNEGGRIFLRASRDAYVDGNGRIVTTGTRGGSVEVLGQRVAVMGKAEIDASGAGGGGKIMVGGDYQGKNPDVQHASISYFGPDARLKADATGVGDGGTVIVWADDTTRAYGSISARGGALGGNGGLVETSGHRSLSITGARVDTRAPKGKVGNWLLDPVDVRIEQYGGSPTTGGVADPFSLGTNDSVVYGEDISTALGSTDVTIQTATGSGGYGNITMTGTSISGGAAYGLSLLAYGGGTSVGGIEISDSTINLGGGALTLVAGWDGTGVNLSTADGSDGSIYISDSWLSAGPINMKAVGDISAVGVNTGTWIESSGTMYLEASNIYLTGGSAHGLNPMMADAGSGVMLKSSGMQTVKASGEIILQAGSANNPTYGGGSFYGSSVAFHGDADQDVSAHVIRLRGGVDGHDNAAEIRASGNQSITIGLGGTGGVLEVSGGGSGGSYNNQARIQHGQWVSDDSYTGTGDQTISIYGGGAVNVQAGSGTGVLGYYGADCYAVLGDACRGGSNDAIIENGIGAQTLDFLAPGAIAITGGSDGTQNWAGIENRTSATTQEILGNPDITLTGGSGGGSAVAVYGGSGEVLQFFELSNDAGIFSEGSGAQTVYAGSISIYGGAADVGGAGFGNESGGDLNIFTTGNLSMYGGSSSAALAHAAAAHIGHGNGGTINLDVGGDIHIEAGSGSSAPAMIGSFEGAANVVIKSGGDVSIIAAASPVSIGSNFTGYGAAVSIHAGGNLTVSDSPSQGVLIGSLSDSGSATNVDLSASKDISIGTATGYGALIGVKSPTGAYTGNVAIAAGMDEFLTPSVYGGNLQLVNTGIRVGGDGVIGMLATSSSGGTHGNIDFTDLDTQGGNVTMIAGWNGVSTNGMYGSIVGVGALATGGAAFAAHAGDSITLDSINTDGSSGASAGNVALTAVYGSLMVGSISATGGDAVGAGNSGGLGGDVTLQSNTNLTLGSGGIHALGGRGSDGGEGYGGGGGGGGGGQVMLTSLIGDIAINGNIVVNGGTGGSGREGFSNSGSGFNSGSGGYLGGGGGSGGGISVNANAGSIGIGSGVALNANGGTGGQGGTGGVGQGYGYSGDGGVYNGYGHGGEGGQGGTGGVGGNIDLSAASGSIEIGSGASIGANGGSGGDGGIGGAGYGFGASSSYGAAIGMAQGGNGGSGGEGGIGGAISLTGGSAGIAIYGGDLLARGGPGGTGGPGGSAFVDGSDQSATYGGYLGNGGNGGNYYYSAGSISLTSYGDIAFSGTLDTRGGLGGSGADGGHAGPGGSVVMIAGSDGMGGTNGSYGSIVGSSDAVFTGGGGFVAHAGGGVTLGSINTDGISSYYGYSGGYVDIMAANGTLTVGSISARGGDSSGVEYSGGFGGSVNLQSYGGLTLGSGGIDAAGGQGSDGGEGYSAGNGGGGGQVTLASLAGDVTVNGNVTAKGGDGGRGGDGANYYGYGYAGNGGGGGAVTITSYGGFVALNGSIFASGGTGGAGGNDGNYGHAGNGGNGAGVTITSSIGDVAVNGSIFANGGTGGRGGSSIDYGYAGDGGSGGQVIIAAPVGSITVDGTIAANGGSGGDSGAGNDSFGSWVIAYTGELGGAGGVGGSITINAAGSIAIGGSASLKANGGTGGDGGAGGVGQGYGYSEYWGVNNGYGRGGEGGEGGDGGGGGTISLNATGGSIVINSGAKLAANGGIGGDGGIGGAGYGFGASSSYGAAIGMAQGGNGGSGGVGGGGGDVLLVAGTSGIAMYGGEVSALGGRGGAGGSGGSAFVDGNSVSATYGGNSGNGGDGGGFYKSGFVSMASYGDIAFSGTLDTRGGMGGSGEYSDRPAPGGSIMMVAGADGMGGTNGTYGSIVGSNDSVFTGGGSFTANAGNSITLGSINTDAAPGYVGGQVDMNAASGSLAVGSISARGGAAWGWGNGGSSGGNVNLQAYGGQTVGSGGISVVGGSGGSGWDGGEGSSGGSGGSGGQVTLTSLTGGIAVNGSIVASGGQGGTGGHGYTFYGGAGGMGGGGGGVFLTAQGGIQFSNAAAFVDGGVGGAGGSGVYGGLAGANGNGGVAQLLSYGGSAGGLAISADIVGSSALTATVDGSATYGGISVRNFGLQPATLQLDDGAANPGTGSSGGPVSIAFYNSGDLTLDGMSAGFNTSNNGDIAVQSGGKLDYYGGGLVPNLGSLLLSAGGELNMHGSLTTTADLKLGAGTLNIDSAIGGHNVELFGATININADVTAENNAALIAPLTGGRINLMGGVTANGLSATPSSITASNGVSLPYTGIAFLAGNLFADSGGYLHATDTAIGNISGLVTGDITISNGANFEAGKDVDLVMTGTASTLSLLNGGYILASPTTIKLDFANRSSGGLVTSGGGGLFVGTPGNMVPAKPGAGLILAYGAVTVVVDPCATNPLLCKTEETKPPTDSTTPVIDTPKADPGQPAIDPTKTTGGTEDTFGGEPGADGPPEQQASETKTDEKKDEKDEKDEKDKKSDEAKDEKKDEKPAQKKVAQCT